MVHDNKGRDKANLKRWRDEWYIKNHLRILEQKRNWQHKNRDTVHRQSKKVLVKARVLVLYHYGGNPPKCACCGETNIGFLTIDHINGGGEKHRREQKLRAGTQFYRWLIHNGYPEGYQVACYNCNCGKAKNNNVCPHKEPEKLRDVYDITNYPIIGNRITKSL